MVKISLLKVYTNAKDFSSSIIMHYGTWDNLMVTLRIRYWKTLALRDTIKGLDINVYANSPSFTQ